MRGGQNILPMVGRTFGRLTVIDRVDTITGKPTWRCACACGGVAVVRGANLRSGHTTSCGCAKVGNPVHGLYGTPTYKTWQKMIERCFNPKQDGYQYYGGRGITVCERWRSFAGFVADMGERPDGTTLDRIDGDRNYESGNCRWADAATQQQNRRPRRRAA